MPTEVEVLDATETEKALAGHRFGRTENMLAQIEEKLMLILDSYNSIWVVGLTDGTINSLRTRMYRRQVAITVRKIKRNSMTGHLIQARTIRPEEQG